MIAWSELRAGVRPGASAVMGIVNVTPDSFSDGGRYLDPAAAVDHGLALVDAGAAILDVGGESTRPGAQPVDADEELRRVLPVVRGLAAATDVPVSVDTAKATVAAAALEAGATIVNDVSAGRADPAMLALVADAGAAVVLMHMAGEPRTMQDDPRYDDVVAEVADFLLERCAAAEEAGVDPTRLAVDPGIGFGKTTQHNLALLADLDVLVDRVGVPVVVGTSRKRFLGEITAVSGGTLDEPDQRDDATLATVVAAVAAGARVVRVHDVRPAARAVALLEQLALAEV